MRGQKTAIILDFDNVLFDTEALKASWIKILKDKYGISKTRFLKDYKKSKTTSGYLNANKLARQLLVDRNIFLNSHFKKFVFPRTIQNLKTLKKMGKIFLISVGDSHYQPKKIVRSGIKKLIGKNGTRVTSNKRVALKKTVHRLQKLHFKQIFVVDDIAQNLVDAKRISSEIITIWVRYGKYKNIQPRVQSAITVKVRNFAESVKFIKNYNLGTPKDR